MMIRKILSNFQKNTTASSAAWQNSREFNRHYCEFIKSFHTNKTLKVKGIFEFTLDHDLWKMPVPGHPTLYIHTTKVEFDKPDKTENKQKNEKLLDRPLFFGEALIYAKNIIVCKKKKKLKMNTATLLFNSFYYPPIRRKKRCCSYYYYKHSIGQK